MYILTPRHLFYNTISSSPFLWNSVAIRLQLEEKFLVRYVVHGAMSCSQKSFKLVWRCHQLLFGFLTKGHLHRVSRQSLLSLMIGMIMEWGLCTGLLAFTFQLRKTLENLSYETIYGPNGVPSHQMRSLESHSTSGRKKKWKNGRTGSDQDQGRMVESES